MSYKEFGVGFCFWKIEPGRSWRKPVHATTFIPSFMATTDGVYRVACRADLTAEVMALNTQTNTNIFPFFAHSEICMHLPLSHISPPPIFQLALSNSWASSQTSGYCFQISIDSALCPCHLPNTLLTGRCSRRGISAIVFTSGWCTNSLQNCV